MSNKMFENVATASKKSEDIRPPLASEYKKIRCIAATDFAGGGTPRRAFPFSDKLCRNRRAGHLTEARSSFTDALHAASASSAAASEAAFTE